MQLFYYCSGKDTKPLTQMSIPSNCKTMDDVSRFLPQGVYTTLRTYPQNQVLFLDRHIDRLERSAYLTGQTIQIDRTLMRKNLAETLLSLPAGEKRIRITVAGAGSSNFTTYINLANLVVPTAQDYTQGVSAISRQMQRQNSEAKVTAFIRDSVDVRSLLSHNVNEVFLIDQNGCILEGLTSNVFCVRSNETWTAGKGILPGITREIVLKVIESNGLVTHLEGYPYADLAETDEVFITSTSRAVLPVIKIDGTTIGSGQPGPITRQISEQYAAEIAKAIQPLYSSE